MVDSGYYNKRRRKYRETDPNFHKNKHLKIKYGITLEQYNEMFKSQKGRCVICGTHQKDLKQRLFVDHDHDTGEIRGLLCSRCNTGLGMFKDDIDILLNAIDYLRKRLSN